jgi:hypothetical protein
MQTAVRAMSHWDDSAIGVGTVELLLIIIIILI